MIRPFSWWDLPWMYRLRRKMLVLDSRQACINPPLALHDILLNNRTFSNLYCTLISSGEGLRAPHLVARIRHRPGNRRAQLCFLGPEERLADFETISLIEALLAEAGDAGAEMLVAEVDESSTVFPPLRRAGFAIYARQRIWKGHPFLERQSPTNNFWRVATTEDAPAMQFLYANLVPPLVQQIEPDPFTNRQFWVHWRGQELLAFLEVNRGPLGVRLQPYVHSAVQSIEDLLAQFFHRHLHVAGIDVYLCIRSYQGGLAAPLDALGFTPWSDQAVMVRRLTAAVPQNTYAAIPTLDGTQAEASAPISQYKTQV